MKPEPKWRTRDGKELYVSQMETRHIWNALQWIKRNGNCSHDYWVDRMVLELYIRKEVEKDPEHGLRGVRRKFKRWRWRWGL